MIKLCSFEYSTLNLFQITQFTKLHRSNSALLIAFKLDNLSSTNHCYEETVIWLLRLLCFYLSRCIPKRNVKKAAALFPDVSFVI